MLGIFGRLSLNSGPGIVRNSAVTTKLGNSSTSRQNAQKNLARLSTLQLQDNNIANGNSSHSQARTYRQNLFHPVSLRKFADDVSVKARKVTEPPVDVISKPKKLDEEEPRWYHRSPTERLENPAYTYLKEHPEYQKLFFQHEICSRLMTEDGTLTSEGELSVNPAVKAFIDLCNSNPTEIITDPAYEPVFTNLTDQGSTLTDAELLLVFYNLRRFPRRPRPNDKAYRQIWQPLDDICYARSFERGWTLEYMFNLADLMFTAGISMHSGFHWYLLKKLYRRVDHLSKEEFIRMMFCFGGVRSLPDNLSIYNIEYNLPKFIDELTPEEIAVVSVGFFRTKTYIRNQDVVAKMLETVGSNASQVPSQSISAVAKAVTLVYRGTYREGVVESFLTAFISEIQRIDVHACASLIYLSTRARVKVPGLLEQVVKKLEGSGSADLLGSICSKEVEYLCGGLTMFNMDCPNLYDEIMNEIRRRLKNMTPNLFSHTHGKHLVTVLHCLCQRGIYPVDLISFALSEEFLGRTFGRSMYTYTPEVLMLDVSTDLDIEDYNGPRLSDKFRQFLTKKNMLWIDAEEKITTSEYQKFARSMLDVCINLLGGPDYCHICNVIPAFRTIGVVYCIDETTQTPVTVPESFVAIDDFITKYIPESSTNDNVTYHAMILFSQYYSTSNSGEPVGKALMHVRQIEKLGYHVHPIYLGSTVTGQKEMQQVISTFIGRPFPADQRVQ